MPKSFDDLWEAFLEGDLHQSGIAALQEMLDADPELLQLAADRYEEHRLIGYALQGFDADQFADDAIAQIQQDRHFFVGDVMTQLRSTSQSTQVSRESHWGWRISRYALVVAATLLLSFLFQSRFTSPRQTAKIDQGDLQPIRYQAVEYVATLARCENCDWADSEISEGARLVPGQIKLESGIAMIQFDGGALALLSGSTELNLDSAAAAQLVSGNLIVRASEEAAGFVLRTPATDIVDLGAEFSVNVDSSGVTEAHVTEGEVRWHQSDRDEIRDSAVLAAGEAVRFSGDDSNQPQSIPMNRRRLSEVMPTHSVETHPGRLIAYEGFDYPFASLPTNRRLANGGNGWGGPWFCGYPASTFELFFTPNQSLHHSSLRHSLGGALRLPTEEVDRWDREATKRELAESIKLNEDGVVYFSFLLQRDSQVLSAARGSFHWILCKPRDLKSRLGVGVLSDGRPIIYGPTGNQAGVTPLRDDVAHFFVGKLVHGKHRPEQLFLKVYEANEELEWTEPFQWTISGRASQVDQPLSQVHLYNSPGRGYMVDEIRVGSTWAAVTPQQPLAMTKEERTQ